MTTSSVSQVRETRGDEARGHESRARKRIALIQIIPVGAPWSHSLL
jgi:hypothetical protein